MVIQVMYDAALANRHHATVIANLNERFRRIKSAATAEEEGRCVGRAKCGNFLRGVSESLFAIEHFLTVHDLFAVVASVFSVSLDGVRTFRRGRDGGVVDLRGSLRPADNRGRDNCAGQIAINFFPANATQCRRDDLAGVFVMIADGSFGDRGS